MIKILVVDDEPYNIEIISQLLPEEYEIVTVLMERGAGKSRRNVSCLFFLT